MKKIFAIAFSLAVAIISCKKVDDANNNSDHNAITTLVITFKQAGVTKYVATFDDPDGIGGNNPVKFDSIVLSTNQTYQAEVTLQNKTGGVIKDMTTEVRTAGREHEFFFTPNNTNVVVTKTDVDIIGFPLGFNANWQTNAITNNTAIVKVQLKHKPFNKGPNDDATKGHDDINIDFPLIIK